MNTEEPVHYKVSGNLTDEVTSYDCASVGDPFLVVVNFGGVSFYTRNAEQLLDNLRTAALELARVIAKQRDTERADNE